jgi:hypothetical protein
MDKENYTKLARLAKTMGKGANRKITLISVAVLRSW